MLSGLIKSLNPLVEKQYTEWVYPEPVKDLSEWVQRYAQICDPTMHHALIWPERAYDPKISILVAGCGTSQAAILAYTNPEASVVGIDISPASLEHTARLKTKHNLVNLELRQMDLHAAATLGQSFDLIYATGVLHHLPDPQQGLAALAQNLKTDGVMCLALYAKYARAGIMMVQEALRRMGTEQTAEGINLTRHVIGSLPPWHPAQHYIRGSARDLGFDGGVVDTFLHKQNCAFTVPDILELTAQCGLTFQTWTDNLDYYPDGSILPQHPAYAKIRALPEPEQWAVIELLGQFCGLHSFLLRKNKAGQVDLTEPDFASWVPAHRAMLDVENEADVTLLSRSWHSLALKGFERDLFLAVDGKRTVGDIVAMQGHIRGREEQVRAFFVHMYRLGHLTFSRFN